MKRLLFKTLFPIMMVVVANFAKAQCPTITVTPLSTTLTCNGPAATITAVFSPTTNVTGVWFGPGNSLFGVSGTSPFAMNTANPGTYTFIATNSTSSCSTTQTVAVIASGSVPSMTINASSGFTTSCASPCTVLSITGSVGPAPISYSWTNVTTSITTTPPTGTYTICSFPGNFIAQYQDGNNCRLFQIIAIVNNPCTLLEELNLISGIKVSPNPNSGVFNFNIESRVENAELFIYNLIGQIVLTKNIVQGNNLIHAEDLSKGIYYYTIQNQKQSIGRGKLLIE